MATTSLTSPSLKYDGHLWHDLLGLHLMDKHPLAEGSQGSRHRSRHIALQGSFPTLSFILYVWDDTVFVQSLCANVEYRWSHCQHLNHDIRWLYSFQYVLTPTNQGQELT